MVEPCRLGISGFFYGKVKDIPCRLTCLQQLSCYLLHIRAQLHSKSSDTSATVSSHLFEILASLFLWPVHFSRVCIEWRRRDFMTMTGVHSPPPSPPLIVIIGCFPLLDKGGVCISSWESGGDESQLFTSYSTVYAGFIPVFACRGLQCKAFNWAGLGYKVFAIVFLNIFLKRWWWI